MKKLVLIVVLLIGCMATYAQKKIAVEVSAGLTYPMKAQVGDKAVGPAFALEGRYYLAGGLDVGLQAYYGDVLNSYGSSKVHHKSIAGLVVADYNFGMLPSFTPFIGAGVGYGGFIESYKDAEDKTKGMHYMARIGVEHKSHVRLTLYGRMGKEHFASYGLSIGYAF